MRTSRPSRTWMSGTRDSDSARNAQAAIRAALAKTPRPNPSVRHPRPPHFKPGQPLEVQLTVDGASEVKFFYRHVEQAETYDTGTLNDSSGEFRGEIPSEYTKADYPI